MHCMLFTQCSPWKIHEESLALSPHSFINLALLSAWQLGSTRWWGAASPLLQPWGHSILWGFWHCRLEPFHVGKGGERFRAPSAPFLYYWIGYCLATLQCLQHSHHLALQLVSVLLKTRVMQRILLWAQLVKHSQELVCATGDAAVHLFRDQTEAVQKDHPKNKSGIGLRTHFEGKGTLPFCAGKFTSWCTHLEKCKCLFSLWAQQRKIICKHRFEICLRAGPKPIWAHRPMEIA